MTTAQTEKSAPKGGADIILAAIQALRMKQWIKNLLVFAALIFAFKFQDIDLIKKASIGFLRREGTTRALLIPMEMCSVGDMMVLANRPPRVI